MLAFGTIYFAINYQGFRRGLLVTLLGVVVLTTVAGLVAYYVSSFNDKQAEQRRQVSRTLIASDQFEITEAVLAVGTVSEIRAVVTNNSPYNLAELALKVTVVDCPANSSDKIGKCTAVGQDVGRVYGLDIPSGQKRSFRGDVSFNNLPPLKPNEWS